MLAAPVHEYKYWHLKNFFFHTAQHPLAALIEVALDAGASLASVLAALVRAAPVLAAARALGTAEGDVIVLGYTQFACVTSGFTSTKVQILAPAEAVRV